MHVLDIICTVSLTLLAVSFFLLTVCLVPIFFQLFKILEKLDFMLKDVNANIMPNLAELSYVFGQTGSLVKEMKKLGRNAKCTVSSVLKGTKAGLYEFFKRG